MASNGGILPVYERASREPLGVDISDYSDDWSEGFLAGQVNALDFLIANDDAIANLLELRERFREALLRGI